MDLGVSLGCGVALARHLPEARSGPPQPHEHVADGFAGHHDLDAAVVAEYRLDGLWEPFQVRCAVGKEVGQLPGGGQVGGADVGETAGWEKVLVVEQFAVW